MMSVLIKDRAKSLETNLKKYKFEIQEIMLSQHKYKGDNRYLYFHERLCRSNQNEIKTRNQPYYRISVLAS